MSYSKYCVSFEKKLSFFVPPIFIFPLLFHFSFFTFYFTNRPPFLLSNNYPPVGSFC